LSLPLSHWFKLILRKYLPTLPSLN
jgi:hypothetical protein